MRIVEAVRVGLRAAGVVSDLYRLAPEAVDVLQSGARLVKDVRKAAPDGLTAAEREALAAGGRRFGEELAQAIEAAPVMQG